MLFKVLLLLAPKSKDELVMTKEKTASIEIPYGWIIIIASILLNTIALGAPNILFVVYRIQTIDPRANEFAVTLKLKKPLPLRNI